MSDLSGQAIKGYELHELIGAGGFGAVYRAYQPVIKRDVAMKIILPEYANHPDFIRRFEFEAQLVARLEHIHIVALYDYWRDPQGAYLIMRWLRGGSLRNMLKEGPVSNEQAVGIVDQVASALGTAHRRGVVHRDLKPDNILFDEDGNAYLADFGIAKDLREAARSAEDREDTNEGALTGSPFYLAPEQAQNKPVTPQTDLYSLGIVMYEMLTGQPPFLGDQGLMAVLLQHIQDPVPSLQKKRPDLPADVNAVIQRATAKDPASRYPDASSLAADFHRSMTGTEKQAAAPLLDEATPLDEVLVFTKPISASTLIIVAEEEVANPYKGLQPFEEADSEDFFGRDLLIEKLLDRLKETEANHRFLAVIGPSGSGKSSVVKAGVIPALRRGALPDSDRWYMVEMVPGHDPFRELESALLTVAVDPPHNLQERLRTDSHALVDVVDVILPPDDDALLLLTIDQFEEVFTMVDDEAARAQFLDLLLTAVQESARFRLIITLRADFYDRPLLYPGFGELVRVRNEVVLPLSPDEMREAIVGPAERAGVNVETGLVAAIIAEIAEQPGALPLMQYALTEVFERREGNILTLDAYHQSGGVLGALARRAEELYQNTAPDGQAAMRQIFLRLVNVGEGTDDTRRRAMQSELMALAEDENVANAVIESVGKYRLLTFDHDPDTRAPTVAIAHEALIREWKRLRGWLDESREDILLQRRLALANEEWQKQDRDPSFLASGMRLHQFENLMAGHNIALTLEELDYIKASVAQREAREAEERARQEREAALEKRSRDRLRALVAVMGVAAVIATVLALIALVFYQNAEDERKNADHQRRIAERNAQISDSLALASSAQTELVSFDNDLAIALALQANQIPDPPIESQLVLAKAALAPGTRRVFERDSTIYFGVAFSPDGTLAISGSYDNLLTLWDVATGEPIRNFEGHESFIRSVDYSPDGKTVLSGAMDDTMILWDVETGAIIRRFGPDNPDTPDVIEGHSNSVRTVVYSPDGTKAVSASDDYTLIYWDLETGDIIHQFVGHDERVRGADISPDGTLMMSASYDGTLKLWDLETGDELRTFTGHTDKVACVAFSPDGTTALSGSADRTMRLWDVATGEEIQRFQGHGSWVKSVSFTPDGRQALSSSDDGSVRLWDVATGDELHRFIGHSDFVEQAVFSPDAYHVMSASGDSTLRLWDLTNGAEIRRFRGHSEGVLSVAVSPDGKTALSGGYDTKVLIWNLETGAQIGEFDQHTSFVAPLLFSPDGQFAVSSDASGDPGDSENNVALMWNVETSEVVQRFVGHSDWINVARFTPDGTKLLTGSKDNTAILWDVETGQPIRTLARSDATPDDQFWIWGLAIMGDGQRAFSSTQDGRVIEWNLATGEEVRRYYEDQTASMNSVSLSPDETMLLLASDDSFVYLLDLASGDTVQRFQGHTASVQRALFSPDGQNAISASYDGTIRLWDIVTGQQIRQLDNGAAVWTIAYTPDGTGVLSGSEDATVRLWDATPLSLDELLQWTRANRYVAELTCRQREQFRIEPLCDAEGNLPS